MKPSQACIDLVKSFEGFSATAYKCPAGVWTVGYGTTEYVTPGDTVTEAEACDLLRNDVQEAADAVDDLVDVELTQPQYDALCSFVYNVGREAFRNSTLLKMLNQGRAPEDIGPQFERWNKAGGQVLSGLVRRRAAERKMFESEQIA
jgi:lysozyme